VLSCEDLGGENDEADHSKRGTDAEQYPAGCRRPYYSSRRQMRPALKVLVEFLRESYRRTPKPERHELSAAKCAAKQNLK
jgi:hypothetical protein